MMNSIRPDALASLLLKGEAENENRPVKGRAELSRPISGEHSEQQIGMHRVVGDRMVRSWSDMNQGSRTGKGTGIEGESMENPVIYNGFMPRRRGHRVEPGVLYVLSAISTAFSKVSLGKP